MSFSYGKVLHENDNIFKKPLELCMPNGLWGAEGLFLRHYCLRISLELQLQLLG